MTPRRLFCGRVCNHSSPLPRFPVRCDAVTIHLRTGSAADSKIRELPHGHRCDPCRPSAGPAAHVAPFLRLLSRQQGLRSASHPRLLGARPGAHNTSLASLIAQNEGQRTLIRTRRQDSRGKALNAKHVSLLPLGSSVRTRPAIIAQCASFRSHSRRFHQRGKCFHPRARSAQNPARLI